MLILLARGDVWTTRPPLSAACCMLIPGTSRPSRPSRPSRSLPKEARRVSALSQTHALAHLVESDATWRLLRADNAPVIAALLSEHLGGEDRRLPTDELHERIDHDLDALRAHGFTLPQSGQGYCAEWRKAGFLTRRPAEEARGETYELAPGALAAIRFLEQLVAPRQTI